MVSLHAVAVVAICVCARPPRYEAPFTRAKKESQRWKYTLSANV